MTPAALMGILLGIAIVITVFAVIVASSYADGHSLIQKALHAERQAKTRFQDRNTTASTIIADTILEIVREEGTYINKDHVQSRLMDAMIGLGYYPTDKLQSKTTDASDSQPSDS